MANPRKRQSVAWLGALLLCIGAAGFVVSTRGRPDRHDPPPVFQKTVLYRFTLHNASNRTIPTAEFWTYAPVGKSVFQRCIRLESSHPFTLETDAAGNRILHFSFDRFSPFASKIITLKADLRLTEKPREEALPDPTSYLAPTQYIESDHPDIIRTAQSLKSETPIKTAESIFRWVADALRAEGYVRRERGALYALRHKKGDCTEFMYLFVALCRAAEVPARCIGGYICPESGTLKPGAYHNWAQFYDGARWQTADPQNKVFMARGADYIAMRIMGASVEGPDMSFERFRVKGDGLKARMNF